MEKNQGFEPVWAMVHRAVDAWWNHAEAQSRCLYLYCKRSTETEYGDLTVDVDGPEGYDLAHTEPISTALTKTQAQNLIWKLVQCLPVLPWGTR